MTTYRPKPSTLHPRVLRTGLAAIFFPLAACSGTVTADSTTPPDSADSTAPEHKDAGPDASIDVALEAGDGSASDAGTDGGCEPGVRKCEGGTPWRCSADGVWTEQPACGWPTPMCVEGTCGFDPICTKQGWCWENPRPFESVTTVWAASPQDLWMGGGDGLLLHWDGARFTVVGLPIPVDIAAIWGSGGNDVFAAGEAGCMPHLGCYSVLAHYDGAAWSVVSIEGDEMYGDLWTAGPTDLWATRPTFAEYPATPQSFVRRWDGSTWSTVEEDAIAVWGSSSDDVWAVGPSGHAVHWDGATIATKPTGTVAELRDVWGVSSDDVWIVGTDHTILRWNGTQLVTVPAPASLDLSLVRGSSASDVWVAEAVPFAPGALWNWDGSSWELSDFEGCVAELWVFSPTDAWVAGNPIQHYDGATWSGPTPSPTYGPVGDVWANAQNDVWVVGFTDSILHWDGASWTQEASGLGGDWRAVQGTTDNVWVVGLDGKVAHWDSVQWSSVSSGTDSSLYDVWVAASDDVWVVGENGPEGFVLRGGQGGLTVQYEASVGLHGIWGTTPADVWAVGRSGTLLHWDGVGWTSVDSPTDAGLNSVFGLSSDDVWAVGGGGATLHWDGSAWSVFDPATSIPLVSLWGASPDDIWAVGDFPSKIPGLFSFEPSTLHWDGSSWSAVRDLGGLGLTGVSGVASGEAWAVGSGSTILHLMPPVGD